MFFDIGANIGKWSVKNINLTDKIISVEGSPITFIKLKNIESDKIITLNYVVSNSKEEYINFYHCKCDTLSTTNKEWLTSDKSRFNNQPYEVIKSKVISLDKLIDIYGTPNLIKVDVEGGEYDCISSLSKKVDILCFEWASELNDVTTKCIEHLESIGFTKFHIQKEDNYTYRPSKDIFTSSFEIKKQLDKMIPKKDWGMIWCI